MIETAQARRQFLATIGAASLRAMLPTQLLTAAAAPASSVGWPGYADAMAIDALCSPGNPNALDSTLTATDLADIRASGITAVNLTVGGGASYANDYVEAIAAIARWDRDIAAHPDVLLKFSRGSDLAVAKRSRRLAVMYGFQDATPLGEELERLDTFRGLGVRVIQLTYNIRNLVGDGCLEPGNAGLSRFGNALVERMNATSMLVDLSHCGRRTTDEAIAASKQPVAITHSGCASVYAHPRNKSDDSLRKLADRGGVIGIYLMPYLKSAGPPTAADVIAHVEHALDVCGEDHVGIGSDGTTSGVKATPAFKKAFADQIADRRQAGISAPREDDTSYTFAADLNTPRRLETIAALLAKRGHPDRVIAKVIGGNFQRLFAGIFADPEPTA